MLVDAGLDTVGGRGGILRAVEARLTARLRVVTALVVALLTLPAGATSAAPSGRPLVAESGGVAPVAERPSTGVSAQALPAREGLSAYAAREAAGVGLEQFEGGGGGIYIGGSTLVIVLLIILIIVIL
jgi:hypothetical protein